MRRAEPAADAGARRERPLPGLEVDNLLGILAGLGLLRALDRSRPDWQARLSWQGPPWIAHLHLAQESAENEVAIAAAEGIESWSGAFDRIGDLKNVSFDQEQFEEFSERHLDQADAARLPAVLAVQAPEKRTGGLRAGPLVLMFGQGHQHFLSRLVAAVQDTRPPTDGTAAEKLKEALFQPWQRADATDAFRWDPEEDQRYALRHGNPSRAGAASTVHGANRLATLGLLSFPTFPRLDWPATPGVSRRRGLRYVWPIWEAALPLEAIEILLSDRRVHRPDASALAELSRLGVVDVLGAPRVANGKFMNVGRAVPFRPTRDR